MRHSLGGNSPSGPETASAIQDGFSTEEAGSGPRPRQSQGSVLKPPNEYLTQAEKRRSPPQKYWGLFKL